jgi:hypothetical protein
VSTWHTNGASRRVSLVLYLCETRALDLARRLLSSLFERHLPEAPLDPYHLACMCPNAAMVAWRVNAQREARSLLCKTAQLLRAAHDGMHRDLSALCDEVTREASAVDVSTSVGQFVLFRLLVMMPWSARLAQDDLSFYAATVIGSLFDASGLPNRLLRPLADTWGHWSIRWCWRLGNAWRAACMQANVPFGT